MINLEATANGVVVPVLAHPRARKNGVTGVHDGRLRIAVTQAPQKGKANTAIAKALAETLGVKRAQVQLVAGQTSRQKSFLIAGAEIDDVRRRIADCLGEE